MNGGQWSARKTHNWTPWNMNASRASPYKYPSMELGPALITHRPLERGLNPTAAASEHMPPSSGDISNGCTMDWHR
uniref:HDC14019 n=1 Tax=Drosophila melanogaster TaxID=7227 RepID=Q6IJX5_DROME|nr:TPA_inf: HDC14019 [Drosophila melanogaster]